MIIIAIFAILVMLITTAASLIYAFEPILRHKEWKEKQAFIKRSRCDYYGLIPDRDAASLDEREIYSLSPKELGLEAEDVD